MIFFTRAAALLLLVVPSTSFHFASPALSLRPNLYHSSRAHTQLASQGDDSESEPLIVPEIVLDEGDEVVRAREAQSSFYRTATWLYGATTFDSLSTVARLGGPPATAMATSVPSAALALAAISVHTLKSASDSSRLNSDTYKRLNLSLMAFGLFNVVSGLASFKTLTPMKSSQVRRVHKKATFTTI